MSFYDWDEVLSSVRVCINESRYTEARARLREILKRGKVPRMKAPKVARLLSVSGMAEEALSLLTPYTLSDTDKPRHTSDEEIVEYAYALCQAGGARSALKELKRVKSLSPRGKYVKGWAHVLRWEFSEAQVLLEEIIDQKLIEGDDLLNVELALGTALQKSGKELKRASGLLAKVATEAEKAGLMGTMRPAVRARAFSAIEDGRPQDCIKILEDFRKRYPSTDANWIAIEDAYIALAGFAMDVGSRESLERLHQAKDVLREKGNSTRTWIRRITFIEAALRKDRSTLLRLYYTSPYASLKENVLEVLQEKNIPPTYELFVGPAPAENEARLVLDLLTGSINGGKRTLKTGNVVQRLLWVLGRDPYYRYRFRDLFQELFPDESVGHASARGRLRQATLRLRTWIRENKLPIELVFDEGLYYLEVHGPCTFIITDDFASKKLPSPKLDDFIRTLAENFKNDEFNTAQVTALTGLSRSSAIRRLDEGVKHGQLIRTGTGSMTRYQVINR